MRPVTHDYQSLNEYTLPLQGKPYYRSSGIIYAVDRNGNSMLWGELILSALMIRTSSMFSRLNGV